MVNTELRLHILVLKEGDTYVLQGLDYDIVAQGETLEQAQKRFECVVIGQIFLDLHHGKQPFDDVDRAPQRYWDLFNEGDVLGSERPFFVPAQENSNIPTPSIRPSGQYKLARSASPMAAQLGV